jgi:hypothetical protein
MFTMASSSELMMAVDCASSRAGPGSERTVVDGGWRMQLQDEVGGVNEGDLVVVVFGPKYWDV